MDRMDADFHCFGTTDEDSDRFIISDNGAAKNGREMVEKEVT